MKISHMLILGANFAGDFDPDGISFIGRLLLQTPDSKVRASLSAASVSLDLNGKRADSIGDGNVEFLYWIGSLQYVAEVWTFSAEYMRKPTDWRGFKGSIFDDMSAEAEGCFLRAAWRTRPDVELMFRYEEGFADRADRSGKKMQEATGGLGPPHSRYSKCIPWVCDGICLPTSCSAQSANDIMIRWCPVVAKIRILWT